MNFRSNSKYAVKVNFYNNSDPKNRINITDEVVEEADDHQLFFEIANAKVSITSTDGDAYDSNENPLLLKTSWTTKETSKGKVLLYLIHEPTSKTGSKRDVFGGETDMQLDININID